MPAEPHGHQLRHGLLLAEPLFGEQLQLDAGREGRHGGLDVFRQQSVDRDVRPRNVILDVRLAVAQDPLLDAFYMVGTIDDAVAKAETMKAE